MTRSTRLVFTVAREELLSLFLAPTRDQGFTIGFTDPSFGGVKLTGYKSPRDGRLHIHLKSAGGKQLLWSSQLDPAFLAPLLSRLFRKWVIPVQKLSVIYVPRPSVRHRLARFKPRQLDEGTTQFPLEASRVRLRTDFRNRRRWMKTSPTEFLSRQTDQGYAILSGSVKVVRPIPGVSTHLLIMSEGQIERAGTALVRLMGFEVLFTYVEAMKLGNPVFRQGRRIVREIYGPKRARTSRLRPV